MEYDELGRPPSHTPIEEVSPAGVVSRIQDVEALVLNGKYPFVLVHTEDGLTGIGECDTFSARLVKPVVQTVLKPLLLGRNALDTGANWDAMVQACRRVSMAGGGAISGVDVALWDITGKALGVPIHQLLGGKRRDRVQFCACPPGGRPVEANRWFSRSRGCRRDVRQGTAAASTVESRSSVERQLSGNASPSPRRSTR
jgi:L-alanine-DL-glutamate epimerase-like enolase superfamily enzyme